MSVCGQSGQTEDESGSEEVTTATAATAAAVRDLYKQKPASKVVRVLTVLAYLLSVSLAAILLSVYYVCVWKSPELPPLNDTDGGVELSAQRAHPHQYMPAGHDHVINGGGDSGVNGHVEPVAMNVTEAVNTTGENTTPLYPEETTFTDTAAPPLNDSLYNDTVT